MNLDYLNKRYDDLESLEYLKNKPSVLGPRSLDKTLSMKDVVKHIKTGVDENNLMLKDLVDRMEKAVPKPEVIEKKLQYEE